jgi:8-oxo-dGTP pyrophosphatase MutT (NUDIX family)
LLRRLVRRLNYRFTRWQRRFPLLQIVPSLPPYEQAGGGPEIAQAVILRGAATGAPAEVLLLLRTSPRAWELPGGAVEPGEAPDIAVRREVREETGLHVEIDRLLGHYRRTGFRPHRSPVYVCRPSGGTLRRNWESIRVQWFPVDDLPNGLFPWYVPVIQDAARGVSHQEEQHQHLGFGAVLAAVQIHVRQVVRSPR